MTDRVDAPGRSATGRDGRGARGRRRRYPAWFTIPWRTAGPRLRWLGIATGLGVAVGAWLIANRIWSPLTVSAVVIVVLVLAAAADREALTIRSALIEYVLAAPAHLRPGFPTDEASAQVWLADPDRTDALDRAAVLLALDDRDGARRALGEVLPGAPLEAVRAERFRIALTDDPDAEPRAEFRRRLGALPADEGRFQALALAVMLLAANLKAGRPWRGPFLEDVGWLRPFRLGRRGWLLVLWRQLIWAAAFGMMSLGLVVFWLIAGGWT